MIGISATDVAIAMAHERGTLLIERRVGRFGEYFAVSDEHGLIEVHNTDTELEERIGSVLERRGR